MTEPIKRAYQATIKGEVIPGFTVRAATPEAARMMLHTAMERRGWFAKARQWVEAGKQVKEAENG